MNKKGFDLQFNWIFVLIAGAVILGFFITLIRSQFQDSDTQTTFSTQSDLGLVLKISQSTVEIDKTIKFSNTLLFSCSGESEFWIDGSNYFDKYNYNIIFSPEVVRGDELLLKSKPLEMPFNLMPAVYLTSKEVDYVFFGDSAFVQRSFDKMPVNSSKLLIATPPFTYTISSPTTVFIMNESDFPPSMPITGAENLYAVVISSPSGIYGAPGLVNFYTYDSTNPSVWTNTGSQPFFGEDLLLGAVVSFNNNIYSCQLDKLLKRMGLMALFEQKILDKYTSPPLPTECASKYGLGANYFSNLKIESGKPISIGSIGNISQIIRQIVSLNSDIASLRVSCPPIY